MDIEARTRRSLEWERLKGFLAAESSCDWSRELCLDLQAHSEFVLVGLLLDETAEALAMLDAEFGLSQDGLPELRGALERLRTGAQMAAAELLDIRRMLLLARKTHSRVAPLNVADFPQLLQFAPQLHSQEQLVRAIDDVFDEQGNIRDDASALLRSLKREVQRIANQTRDELLRIINSATASKALQEPLFTQRNGRYVLPVQATMRGAIQGIVHDSSASGMTVYVEPLTVVELTNKARLKEAEIEREIERLLSELSANAREHHEELAQTYRALVELDFIAARARLARKYSGVKPALSSDGTVHLKEARHPLLVLQNLATPSRVVANNIVLGDQVRTLVITGPNTGGKTVYLKTAGLLALMTAAGLLLPVAPGSVAKVFKRVFADIGDEQSIEQNLSTFSSHMTNIIEIVRQSGEDTLALLDEVGAGTDPREGAVLARVILERLNESGAFTIATTHYGEMKTLAYTTGGFINGSFEFDDVHLTPTYHLRIGVPGSSKAVTIAARLGLDADLVGAAQAMLSSDRSDIQQMIEQLEQRLSALDEAEQAMRQRQNEMQTAEERIEELRQDLQEQKEKLRAGAASQMERELQEARELVRSLISDLQKQPSISKAQKMQKDLEVIRQELGWLEPAGAEGEEDGGHFAVGQAVKVKSLNQRGVIEEISEGTEGGARAQATVRAGAMRIKVPLSDLQAVQGAGGHGKGAAARTAARKAGSKGKTQTAALSHSAAKPYANPEPVEVFVRTTRNTIDLRGQRVEQALSNVERFVDSAYLEHLSPLMIIHGHGTGQLRAAIRRFLTEAPYQASWRPGENYEGGDGVTVVQFT